MRMCALCLQGCCWFTSEVTVKQTPMSLQHTAAPGSGHFGSLWFQFSLRTLIKLLFVNTCPPYDSHLPSYQKHLNHSRTSTNMQHLHERPLTSRALKMNLNETKVVSPVRTNCRAALGEAMQLFRCYKSAFRIFCVIWWEDSIQGEGANLPSEEISVVSKSAPHSCCQSLINPWPVLEHWTIILSLSV